MSLHRFVRVLPAVLVTVLLAAAAGAPRTAQRGPAPPALFSRICDSYSVVTSGDAIHTFPGGGGVSQPLPSDVVVAACSLHVQATGWAFMHADLRDWDPVSIAPDPHTVALRSIYLDPSDLVYYTQNRMQQVPILPPVVSNSVAGVADAPRHTTAIEVTAQVSSFICSYDGYYDPAGSSALPAARMVGAGNARPALAGEHPVLAQGLCLGDAAAQDLRVGQAVSRTDDTLRASDVQVLQRFRVPEAIAVHWIEIAVGEKYPFNGFYLTAGKIAILDTDGAAVPPTTLPTPIADSYYPLGSVTRPSWVSTIAFDRMVMLVPGHDYDLLVDGTQGTLPVDPAYDQLLPYTRTLTGAEGPQFTSAIGALHVRPGAGVAWTAVPGRALSFKLIGTPALPVSSPPPPRASFLLAVAPNPARGATAVAWSGAVGSVRLEVLDARGRRVAASEGGAAGHWSWSATSRGGQPLPAGVYFVRAHDSAGGQAVERLVIVR